MVLFTIKNCVLKIESRCLTRFLFYSAVCNTNICHKNFPTKYDNNSELLTQDSKKCIKVAFIGLPNAGKSTLVNQLARRKVCPASSKVHTTMQKAEAVYTENDTQIIFMDTPGLMSNHELKKYKLADTFKEDPTTSIKEADVIGIIQDVTNVYTRHKINEFVNDYLKSKREETPLLLIFNKIDRLKKKTVLLELTNQLTKNDIYPKFDDIFMISALIGDGIDDLRNYLIDSAKVKDWKYGKECYTDQSFEIIIQQTVRAKLMDLLPSNIPYLIKVKMESFGHNEDGGIHSVLILNCPKETYVRTLLKHRGNKIKCLSLEVEKELRNAFRKPVLVRLCVQCEKKINLSTN